MAPAGSFKAPGHDRMMNGTLQLETDMEQAKLFHKKMCE